MFRDMGARPTRRPLGRVCLAALFYFGTAAWLAVGSRADDAVDAPPRETPPSRWFGDALPLEDQPEPLVPRRPPDEADDDRAHALAHFAAGRACQHRKEYAEALRHYQRSLRYDPSAKNAVWPIVALAEKLQWPEVRDRYLLTAARLDPDAFDPTDLIELAELVTTDEDLGLVTRLFEDMLGRRAGEKQTPLDVVLRWRLAEIHLANEQYAKAADRAAEVLAALERPESIGLSRDQLIKLFELPHPPYWLFGDFFLLANRLDEAESTFKKAHREEPNAGRLHYELARIAMARDQAPAALDHLEACFRENFTGDGEEPYALLRQALARLHRSDELLPRVEKLLADHPDNASLARFAAEQFVGANQLERATTLYEWLSEKEPGPCVWAGLLKVHCTSGKFDDVLRVLGKAAAEDPSLSGLGDRLQAIACDAVLVDRLFAAAGKQLAANPAALGAHVPLALAMLANEAKRPDDARRFFELAARAAPDDVSDVLLLWGGSLMAQNQYAQAADVFRRAVGAKTPETDKPIFHYYLASALELAGQTDEALAAAGEACRLNPNSPLLAGHEGWILYHAGRNQEARAAYERLIARFDGDHSSDGTRQILREARLVSSHLEVKLGDKQKAAELLEQVLDEFPNDVAAMNDLGYLWAEEGLHPQRSLAMVRRAAAAEPDNAAYRDSLGWALFRSGRLQEAVVELEKAATLLPDGEILDHLGEVHLKLGNLRQADDAWRRAAEAFRKADEPKAADAIEVKRKNAETQANTLKQ